VVVQTWLDGRQPSSEADWGRVARELQRLHSATADHRQRPGCATVRELRAKRRSVDADLDAIPPEITDRILAVFDRLGNVPLAVVHGDPGSENIRIGADGTVSLVDWDESRVDLTWHDLSNLGVQVLDDDDHHRAQLLSNAWEAANGWASEPEYALRRFKLLDKV
jgi:Ser/Thr protein kinase RdoA (MazF antagonist)